MCVCVSMYTFFSACGVWGRILLHHSMSQIWCCPSKKQPDNMYQSLKIVYTWWLQHFSSKSNENGEDLVKVKSQKKN